MENTQRIERSRESCGDVLALDILSVLSILVSGVVVLYKGRQAKLRLFPNSFLLFNWCVSYKVDKWLSYIVRLLV